MTDYIVRISAPAARDLAKLPEKVAAAVMEFLAGPLSENPRRVGKPLVGDEAGLWAARRGVYRIIYRIVDQIIEVHVMRIRHRRDAHRPA